MNDIVKLPLGVSLGDSWLASYTFSAKEGKLILLIKLWTEKILEISFVDPILFLDEGYESIEFFCENKDQKNKLLVDAVKKIESSDIQPLGDNSYRLFQFVELDFRPSLQIIATNFYYKIYDET